MTKRESKIVTPMFAVILTVSFLMLGVVGLAAKSAKGGNTTITPKSTTAIAKTKKQTPPPKKTPKKGKESDEALDRLQSPLQ
jgi:hypothetical protein